MEKYNKFSPTPFDRENLMGGPLGIEDYGVLLTQNRDSEALDRSNFAVALEMLGGESDSVQVHRFGHWACGWFEVILVQPDTPAWAKALEIEAKLADYPVLDEEHWSNLEYTENTEAGMIIDDRTGEWVWPEAADAET